MINTFFHQQNMKYFLMEKVIFSSNFAMFYDFLLAGEGGLGSSGVDLEAFHTVSTVSEPSTCSSDIIDRISKDIFFHDFLMEKVIFWIQKVHFRRLGWWILLGSGFKWSYLSAQEELGDRLQHVPSSKNTYKWIEPVCGGF